MTNLIPIDILLVLILVTNIFGQWYWGTHPDKLRLNTPMMKIQPMVTRANPEMVNESTIGQGESAIVEPKTPQRVAFEESEELRKMQFGPPR